MQQPLSLLIATWFGIGKLPKAPGTWGSLAAIPFWFFFLRPLNFEAYFTIVALITFIGWFTSYRLLLYTAEKDPCYIVIDEVVGMWIALIATTTLKEIFFAFVLFRILDIWKPWPISWADHLEGSPALAAWAVMLDDIIAGFISFISLLLVKVMFW